MNRTTRFLAPASLAISAYCPKALVQAIVPHRHLNTLAKASFLSQKSSLESCPKQSYMDKLDCKLSSETSDIAAMNDKEDISCALQRMHVSETMSENINSLDINLNSDGVDSIERRSSIDRSKYKEMRTWKKIGKENKTINPEESFTFKLLSFNILAQDLLETHAYLYRDHNRQALPWEKRKPLLVQEILESEAHVVCLQEMQEEHLRDFLLPFQENGFTYLYKKRTNDKKDGLLLMYREDIFNLIEFSKLELYQTGVPLLCRDNVALIAKFSLKESPETKFVIATTHLLFNPRRNDVRLGQVQLLFAEIERISFVENTSIGPRYLPIVLSGDFNLEPYSGVYKFITDGSIEFVGKGRNLERCDYRCLTNSLIPPHLYVTDECQHFNVLSKRLSGKGSGKVMLRNTEREENLQGNDSPTSNSEVTDLVDLESTTYQKVEISDGHYVTFSSGLLTHPFQFKSVYGHTDSKGKSEATTFQNRWITVDYIFYSKMQPLESYRLPTAEECKVFFPTIPNSVVGSDHLCLGASFLLKKR
ncbi:protein angel isoform X1 [Nasonia vitripennis]|uniref:Endonuclease/exonuclease/phosphatase domain-containing protein n=2 Tax=Nasonia vitripennis TaxID=7425 RepID=A0A7M7H7C7_NASVI|nr:protein angel isoform X1 [Nasonia vitripennis]XP_008210019.1 protein angel isoform X1 [Nasonia vitripennis]